MIRRIPVAMLAVLLGAASLASARAAGDETAPQAAAKPAPQAHASGAPVTPAPVPTLAPTQPAEPSTAPAGAQPARSASGLRVVLPSMLPAAGATQPYATFVKGATTQSGVIDLIRKDDDLYFDLGPANFDHTYVIVPSIERGVGSGAFAGRVYNPITVTFKLVGKRVLWLTPNTRYVAPKGSAAANSLAISVGDSVILSTPVVAEDKDKKHVEIAPSLFLTDFENVGADLGRGV